MSTTPRIQVMPFDAARDYAMVAAWWRAHGMPPLPPHWLPPVGLIAHGAIGMNSAPCAALWLYTTSARALAYLELLVTNPWIEPRLAAAAVDAVIKAGLIAAREAGAEAVIAGVTARSVARVCARHGFRRVEGVVMIAAATAETPNPGPSPACWGREIGGASGQADQSGEPHAAAAQGGA